MAGNLHGEIQIKPGLSRYRVFDADFLRTQHLELDEMDMNRMRIHGEIVDVPFLGATFDRRLGGRRIKWQWAKPNYITVNVSAVLGRAEFGSGATCFIYHLEQTQLADMVRVDPGGVLLLTGLSRRPEQYSNANRP